MKNEVKIGIGLGVIVLAIIAFISFGKNSALHKANVASTGEKCMITLFEKQYDVTTFRNIHRGGNVFVCGTDMTQQYTQQHGTDISRIQQFLN